MDLVYLCFGLVFPVHVYACLELNIRGHQLQMGQNPGFVL
jgi:hypothetical protein